MRAVGLLGAVQLSREELQVWPSLLEEVVANARQEGILTRSLPSAVHLSPALVSRCVPLLLELATVATSTLTLTTVAVK